MICLNYLKPNIKAKGEFKAQYNNHKNLFTYCTDENELSELSNTFGT